jgi:hypothetical protein
MEFTKHFKSMLKERSIQQEWVYRAINEPEKTEDQEDGTRHLMRRMEEHGNRWLRVVITIQVQPNRADSIF